MISTAKLALGIPSDGPRARDLRGEGGIGRASSPAAERVSDDLRLGTGEHLARRRRQTALMVGATAAMGAVALYQTGVVRRLPDPPLPGVDSEAVDASGEAYVVGRTPDAALAIASYGVTLALVGAGAADRARTSPLLPLLAAAKIAADTAGAAFLTVEQITRHRKLCAYCLAAAAASVAALPQALPEARAAWRQRGS